MAPGTRSKLACKRWHVVKPDPLVGEPGASRHVPVVHDVGPPCLHPLACTLGDCWLRRGGQTQNTKQVKYIAKGAPKSVIRSIGTICV